MANVKFWRGTAANYTAVETKDADQLYFLTDAGIIMRGTVPMSTQILSVTAWPENPVTGVCYAFSGTVKRWNGTAWETILEPSGTSGNASVAWVEG